MSKRLYKVEDGKMIDGVCAGFARYFDVDVTIVRLAWIAFTLLGGSGVLAYFIAMLLIPSQERIESGN